MLGIKSSFSKTDISIKDVFKDYVECHGMNGKVKGQVDLLGYSGTEDIKKDPELLQMVLEVIDFGEMPLRKKTQSSKDQKKLFQN